MLAFTNDNNGWYVGVSQPWQIWNTLLERIILVNRKSLKLNIFLSISVWITFQYKKAKYAGLYERQ